MAASRSTVATYTLPLTMPPHAIHGTVLDRAWTVEVVRARRRGDLAIDLGPDWPFAGRVTQRFVLGRGGLKVSMTAGRRRADAGDDRLAPVVPAHAHRHGRRAEPAVRAGAARVRARADVRAWRRMAMPTGRLVAPSAGPWDDCFTGVASPPRLVWPDRFALEVASSCDHWVVYTEPEHAICVEPQTGPPDAVELRRGRASRASR